MRAGPALFFARRILGLRSSRGNDPKSRAERGQGRRYLRGAVLGVALSIVPLVLVLIIADGMIQGITARYIEVGTYHLQAQPFVDLDLASLEGAAAALRSRPGVLAFPEYQGFGVAISGSRTAGVALRAVDPSFLADPGTKAYLKASAGDLRLDAGNQILLGEALAKDLDARVGGTVSIVTSRPSGGAASSFAPKVSVFRVRGIVSAGYRELDALWAFVPLGSAARIFSQASSRAIIGIKVRDPFGDIEAQRVLARESLSSAWRVLTWPEAERNVYKSFATTRALLLLVMAIAVAVAAINVSSALVMLVLERRRDIAILKSAGASPAFIGRIFIITGLAIGGMGTLIGIGFGSLLAWRINDLISLLEGLVNGAARLWAALSVSPHTPPTLRLLDPSYYLEVIPVHIKPGELALVAAASLGLCLFASLFPAGRAAKLPPLEIFRKT